MEDVDDYSGHAEEVLSGLRSAVGNADEQLMKLQKELDLLESKAQCQDDFDDLRQRHESISSGIDDEDISKYLEECSQNTIDNSILASLRSSASLEAVSTPEKLLEPGFQSKASMPAEFSVSESKLNHIIKRSKTSSDESSTVKEAVNAAASTEANEERWECLKKVLSEDRSGSTARNEMFKQILEATEKKHRPTPTGHQLNTGKNTNPMKPMSIQQAPKYTSPYDGIFAADSENSEEKLQKAISGNRDENRLPADEVRQTRNSGNRYFRPIQNELTSRSEENDSHSRSEELEEANTENKRLQNLLEEEKKRSDKLADKVSTLEKDLEQLQVEFELKNHEESTGKICVVIDEIQKAQKFRENAMMERLRAAARDRDEAMTRAKAIHLKHLQSQRVESLCKEKGDKTLLDLVEKITMADSARIIDKYGSELVQRMNNLKNARARITAEEMAALIAERDDAVAKCHALRQELQNCTEEINSLKRSRNMSLNTNLKAKVLSTREECHKTQEKLHNAEEEIQMLRIYYSLHKSLTLAQDKDLAEKYHRYMENIRDEAVQRAEQAKKVEAENHELHGKLLSAVEENEGICKENARTKEDAQNLKAKCGKLERLVKVLRRKLVAQAQESVANTCAS